MTRFHLTPKGARELANILKEKDVATQLCRAADAVEEATNPEAYLYVALSDGLRARVGKSAEIKL